MIRVGLMGYGKAGQSVANVLATDPRLDLRWIARRSSPEGMRHTPEPGIDVPVVGLEQRPLDALLDEQPVDALVDFSQRESVHAYGEELRRRKLMLLSAISAYEPDDLAYLHDLGRDARVLASPNITLGINFVLLASRMLRIIAPFADIEILEQHFRDKPEVSGTARKIAQALEVEDERITSLRLGGIVGHHEVIFGFPNQTVRIIHDAIRREAFGTGAAFALRELAKRSNGFYTFDDLLMHIVRGELLKTPDPA